MLAIVCPFIIGLIVWQTYESTKYSLCGQAIAEYTLLIINLVYGEGDG